MERLEKICTSCGVLKPLEMFSRQRERKDGRKSNCKECVSKSARRYYDENKEQLKKKWKKYYENNKEKCNKASAKWAKENVEKSRARFLRYRHKNLEKVNNYNRLRRLSNLARDAAKTAKRRSRKREATPNWLTEEHMLQILSFYEESSRLSKSTGVKHHVDHIVPLRGKNVCGLHVPWNLQVITAEENLKKRNKYDDEQPS